MAPKTMRAVVFHGPQSIKVEERPVPTIQDDGDVIVEVKYSALCGSELHVFRGHQPSPTGFIMGHEFTGTITATGRAVTRFKVGDAIVSPFTVSCGHCFYCLQGFTSRCAQSKLFGTQALDGAQAQYVRIPMADATVVKKPAGVRDEVVVLMADIFPTGWFAARNAFVEMRTEEEKENETRKREGKEGKEGVVAVVVGCGPVGLCALVAAKQYNPTHLFAIDSIPSRLALAASLGAEPLNFQTDMPGLQARIKAVTGGRGADVAMEVVGNSAALRLAFDVLRPWGVLSSVGVHNREIPWSGNEAYGKNIRVQMGRCPVRAIFEEALEVLVEKQDDFGFMADKIMPLTEAVEGYELFDKMKVQKVIFEAQK